MSDLIKREDAIKAIHREARIAGGSVAIEYADMFQDAIKALPSADRPQGEWIDRSDGGRILNPWWETYGCSKCGQYGTRIWNFCPSCGADMRERKESE